MTMEEAEKVAVVASLADDPWKQADYLRHSLPEFNWHVLIFQAKAGW